MDVERVRSDLAEKGYSYLPDLPPTADFLGECRRLGRPMAQYGGELVRDIKVDPRVSRDQVSAYNTSELTPHTEWYEFPDLPPRFVALRCVTPAAGEGGETTLADGYRMLASFSHPRADWLYSDERVWGSAGLRYQGIASEPSRHPILARHGQTTVIRFSSTDLLANDDLVSSYIQHGRTYFAEKHVAIDIAPDAMLIWDNWRMLHARRKFADPARHLQRVLIGTPAVTG